MDSALLESVARARLGAGRAIYVPDKPERGLGAALAWADRERVETVDVVVRAAAGVLARQAAYFSEPGVTVWAVDGGDLVEVPPDPMPDTASTPPDPELVDLLRAEGLEVVVEGGTTRGEVLGLEVARIAGEGGDTLEVGVGTADRELTAMLHGELAPVEQLRRAAVIVRQHRRSDAPPHPLNQLVPERWLRVVIHDRPSLVGLAELRSSESPWPRQNLRDRGVAIATGRADVKAGPKVVMATSVGVDLDLVPTAADSRAALDPQAELWLVIPRRDDHEITRRLAARLETPARIVVVPDDWRSLSRPSP